MSTPPPMIDLNALKAASVSSVPLGQLVRYMQTFALRIEVGDDAGRLLMFGDAVIADDVGGDDNLCVPLGKPLAVWDGASQMTPFGPNHPLPPTARLVLLRDGPAVLSATPWVSGWNLSTGKRVAPDSGYAVTGWQIGVLGIECKFVPLLKG
jgi:hypothetical protein